MLFVSDVNSNYFWHTFMVCADCSVELMSALVSGSNLLVVQIETDVYSMLRKVMYCSVKSVLRI